MMFCAWRAMKKSSRRAFVCGSAAVVAATAAAGAAQAAPSKDIVDTAIGAGMFNTLATALKAAGLVETLKGDGPFTVFAPIDEAFARLPQGTLDELLKPENREKLTAILTYHVVAGQVPARKALTLNSAKTVNGQSLALRTFGGSLFVDQAKVIKADVHATNGIIHVIDTVVLPK